MKIGRLQIIWFENIVFGFGKAKNSFWIKINKRGFSFQIFKWCLMARIKRKRLLTKRESLSGKEFCELMKSKGIDISKATSVEISVNGIKPI